MTERENYLKAVRFENPDWIPVSFCINGAVYNAYPHDLIFDCLESHPFLFPGFVRPNDSFAPTFQGDCKKDVPFTDEFGCVWLTKIDGIRGAVIKHPLYDWDNYSTYQFPSLPSTDWDKFKKDGEELKKGGHIFGVGLPHGHTFLRLSDIRGYQNLLYDMADEEPLLSDLINKIEDYNYWFISNWIKCDVDMIGYAEDLGMQKGPLISPSLFKKYIKPSYTRLMKPARDKGIIIHMHSDGDIRTLADDLIYGGVDVINLQDLVNGIDWIASNFAGRICVDLDIDRQSVITYGTAKQINQLIHEEVTKIGSKKGGLTMVYGWYPGVPIENIIALMDALEKYAFYYI